MPQRKTAELALQLGQSVRRLWKYSGLTQVELATRANLHQTHLVGIEAGTRNVTVRTIATLARALNVGADALFNLSDQPPSWLLLSGAPPFRQSH